MEYIIPKNLTGFCGRVVSKIHSSTLILTCLWTSKRVLMKALYNNEKRCKCSNVLRHTYHLARIYLRHPQWPEQACDHPFLKRKLLPSGRPRSPYVPQTQGPCPRIRPSYCGAGLQSMARHFSTWVFQVSGADFAQLKLQQRNNIFSFQKTNHPVVLSRVNTRNMNGQAGRQTDMIYFSINRFLKRH